MAWNTGTTYSSGSALSAALVNGIGTDLRAWGGNVDGAGYDLANAANVFVTASIGIGTTSPLNKLQVHGTTNQNLGIRYDGSMMGLGAFNDAGSAAVPMNFNASLFSFVGGNMGIGTASPTSPLQVLSIPVYANNAAAISGGLTAGAFYRTGANPDPICVVH